MRVRRIRADDEQAVAAYRDHLTNINDLSDLSRDLGVTLNAIPTIVVTRLIVPAPPPSPPPSRPGPSPRPSPPPVPSPPPSPPPPTSLEGRHRVQVIFTAEGDVSEIASNLRVQILRLLAEATGLDDDVAFASAVAATLDIAAASVRLEAILPVPTAADAATAAEGLREALPSASATTTALGGRITVLTTPIVVALAPGAAPPAPDSSASLSNGNGSSASLQVALTVVLFLVVAAFAFLCKVRRKRTRAAITKKLPMMSVVHASSGALFDHSDGKTVAAVELYEAPRPHPGLAASGSSAALMPSLTPSDCSPAGTGSGSGTSGASSTLNISARMRARIATGRSGSSTAEVQEPVVVHVPLPDLNRPIVAHLDANHQIMSTRDEDQEAQMGTPV